MISNLILYNEIVVDVVDICIGHGWPLNHHFMFDLTTLIAIFILLISFGLPKSSEKKRIPDYPDDQDIDSYQETVNLSQNDIFNLDDDIDQDINTDQDNTNTDQKDICTLGQNNSNTDQDNTDFIS